MYVGSLDSADRVRVLERGSRARYASGHLFFTRDRELVAQRFNLNRLSLEGDAIRVAEIIGVGGSLSASGAFSVSASGVVVYEGPATASSVRLEWLDRKGERVGTLGDPGPYADPAISPDGSRTAFFDATTDFGNRSELWVYDNARGDRKRLPSSTGNKISPVWSPDGSTLAFASRQIIVPGRPGWLRVRPLAADEDRALTDEVNFGVPTSWSRDDQFLMFSAFDAASKGRGQTDIWVLPLSGERKPRKYRATAFNDAGGVFSPDGRNVAYYSDESGRNEVYVAPFPDAQNPMRVSSAGGSWPQWRSDGRELFYLSLDGQVMAVDVTVSPLRFGPPRALFKTMTQSTTKPYSPDPDGQRFLVATSVGEEAAAPLTLLVTKW